MTLASNAQRARNDLARLMAPGANRAPAKPKPAPKAEVATRPRTRVYEKVAIEPVNLNAEVPAADWNLCIKLICDVLTTYARFEKPEHVYVTALWIASTWFVEPTEKGVLNGHMMFEAHPRLFVIAEKGSGKNRLMKIVRNLVRNPTVLGTGNVTSYGVRDAFEDGMTVFIDEYHKRVGSGQKQLDLQELVLAYSRESGSIDGRGGKYNEHNTFGPLMLAAQPSIKTGMKGEALADLFERSFIITMPKWTDRDDPIPDLDDVFESKCEDLRVAMELWAAGLYETLGYQSQRKIYSPIHDIPDNLTGRKREISLPLLFVADIAVNPNTIAEKGRDTEWAEYARNAVQVVLLGHGNNAGEIMASLMEKFKDSPLFMEGTENES